MTGYVCTRWLCVVFASVGVMRSESAVAQATTPVEAATSASTSAVSRTADARKAVSATAKPEATAVIEAGEKAAKAAIAAVEAATKAAEAAKDPMAMLPVVISTAGAAAKSATAASAAANEAASASAIAANAISTEPAKSIAGKASTSAFVAAKAAEAASAAAEKANATVAKTVTVPAAQSAARDVVAATYQAATETSNAAVAAAIVGTEAATPSLSVTDPQDETVLAALRARITGGAIFFNGAATIVPNADRTAASLRSNQFSQAATYLAFEAQPRLWSADLGTCPRTDTECRANREVVVRNRGYNRVYVDPFVNVRLTTIPVAGSTADAGPIQVPTQTFLQSQKAVQLQLGAMGGFNFGKFPIGSMDFHWGAGPVARFMFQSVTDSQRQVRLWDIDNDLFKLRSLGLRLTLYQRGQAVGESVRDGWASAAYIDVSRGTFENFQTATGKTPEAITCLADPPACLVRPGGVPPSADFEKHEKMRWYIEGRVFLRYLYLGFDLNTGNGPDDLRFIAGLTVKLDQFVTRRN